MSFAFNIPFKVEKAVPPAPVWTWIDGYSLGLRGDLIENQDWSVLDYFFPVAGSTITWRWAVSGSYTNNYFACFGSSYQNVDYWSCNQASGQRTVNNAPYANIVYGKFCFKTSDKDYCFIRNDTTGEYLYKGSLVV